MSGKTEPEFAENFSASATGRMMHSNVPLSQDLLNAAIKIDNQELYEGGSIEQENNKNFTL